MAITTINPSIVGPVTNITPFTYRDNYTYLRLLEGMRRYITDTLVPEIDAITSGLVDDVNGALAAQSAEVEAEIAQLTQYVDAAVESIIGSSVVVQDAVVQQLILNVSSLTRIAGNSVWAPYGLVAAVNALSGELATTADVISTGRLSEATLNSTYADQATEDAVNTGRLSETSLDARYADQATEDTVNTGRLSVNNLNATIVTAVDAIIPQVSTHGTIEVNAITDYSVPAYNENLFLDGAFQQWDNGTDITIPTESQGLIGSIWRVLTHGALGAEASRLNSIAGGLKLDIDFQDAGTEYVYVRQLIPNVMQFSNGTYSLCLDLESPQELLMDMYGQARYNVNDTDRVLALGTPHIVIPPGRHRLACTFKVPLLAASTYPLDYRNAMEIAFRFLGGGLASQSITVREAILVPGDRIVGPLVQDESLELQRSEAYVERGGLTVNGYSNTSGQKRFPVQFNTKKWRAGSTGNIQVYDATGAIGKISTYDAAGTRTDGVAYTTLAELFPNDSYISGFAIIVNGSVATGASFSWTYKIY